MLWRMKFTFDPSPVSVSCGNRDGKLRRFHAVWKIRKIRE